MARHRIGSGLLTVWAALVLAFLFLPIAVVVLFSFNEPGTKIAGAFRPGRYNYQWGRFSLDAWAHPFRYGDLKDSFLFSLRISVVATILAVILGTAMSLALVKYRFRGKSIVNTIIVLPLTMPEVVLGFSLLTLFVDVGIPRGFVTIVIAHVMFSISYVAITLRARVSGFDWRLEEAAADLGATPWQTFRRVTFPIIAPGVAAAALLTFALSIDDFIITYFTSGSKATFPIEVWNTKRSAIPPQINVFGTAVLLVSVALAVGGLALSRRRERAVSRA
jgi:spermidine/putrescine transport system permease protein